MSSTAFPTLPSGALPSGVKPDSSNHGEQLEDPSMRAQLEGGYVFTRARHTRAPRTTWPVKYTEIHQADKNTLKDFWTVTKGGALIFDWVNPEDGLTYQVRFKEPMAFSYKGIGTTKLWDCSFSVEQA